MPVSYRKLFDLMQERGVKKVDLRTKYKINPKTVDSLVNNKSLRLLIRGGQNAYEKALSFQKTVFLVVIDRVKVCRQTAYNEKRRKSFHLERLPP